MDAMIEHIDRHCMRFALDVRKLTSPLFTHYGIDVFFYCHIDEKGRFSALNNHDKVVETWYDHEFYYTCPLLSSPYLFQPMNFFARYLEDHAFMEEKRIMFDAVGVRDDYFVVRKTDDGQMELFGFASSLPQSQLAVLAHSAPRILEKFIDYFLEHTVHQRACVHENAVSLLPFRKGAFHTGAAGLHAITNYQQLHADFLGALEVASGKLLTDIERRCVELYLRGASAAESAEKLSRSRRTIETHFERIKIKLNLKKKSDLLRMRDSLWMQ